MNLQQQKLCCIVHVFCIFVFCLLFASALLQGIHFLCNLCTFLQVVLFVHFFCWMCNFAVHFCRVCSFSAFLLWSVYFLCTSAFLQGVLFCALLLQGVFFVHFCISVGCTFCAVLLQGVLFVHFCCRVRTSDNSWRCSLARPGAVTSADIIELRKKGPRQTFLWQRNYPYCKLLDTSAHSEISGMESFNQRNPK